MSNDEIPTVICAAVVFVLCVYQTEIVRTLRLAWSCRCRGKPNACTRTLTKPQAAATTTKNRHAEVQFDEGCLKPFTTEPMMLTRSASKRSQPLSTPSAYRRRHATAFKQPVCCDLTQTSCEEDSSSGRPWRLVEESRIPGSIIEVDMGEIRDVPQTTRSEMSLYTTPTRRQHRKTSSLGSAAMSSVSKNVRRKMLDREKSWSASPHRLSSSGTRASLLR